MTELTAEVMNPGEVFRTTDRHRRIAGRFLDLTIPGSSSTAVAGLDVPASYAGNAMRTRFATVAVWAGISELRIVWQPFHTSLKTSRYYSHKVAFSENLSAEIKL